MNRVPFKEGLLLIICCVPIILQADTLYLQGTISPEHKKSCRAWKCRVQDYYLNVIIYNKSNKDLYYGFWGNMDFYKKEAISLKNSAGRPIIRSYIKIGPQAILLDKINVQKQVGGYRCEWAPCWNLKLYDFLHTSTPGTGFIFVYNSPVEAQRFNWSQTQEVEKEKKKLLPLVHSLSTTYTLKSKNADKTAGYNILVVTDDGHDHPMISNHFANTLELVKSHLKAVGATEDSLKALPKK